jgi:hypothetical protein
MIPIDRGGEGDTPTSRDSHIGSSNDIPGIQNLMKHRLISTIAASILLIGTLTITQLASADALRGTLVHEETLRVAPSADAARVGDANRGNELIIIESSRDWVQAEAIVRAPSHEEDATEEESEGKAITGWLPAKGVVTSQ